MICARRSAGERIAKITGNRQLQGFPIFMIIWICMGLESNLIAGGRSLVWNCRANSLLESAQRPDSSRRLLYNDSVTHSPFSTLWDLRIPWHDLMGRNAFWGRILLLPAMNDLDTTRKQQCQ